MTIERHELGDDLALRPFEERDADALFALVERSRAHLAPWMPWLPGHATREDSLGFIRASRQEIDVGTSAQLAIVECERVVGVASLFAIDRGAGRCRCGYWIAPDREGRGIVTRAMLSLLDHAFADLGLEQVELRVAPDNVRSRRVAERLGFRCLGRIDGTELFGEQWRDQLQYAQHVDAWRARGGG